MPTKTLITVLWMQLLLGCIAAVLSWGPMFAGAMGTEWTSGLKKELATVQHSADYREPPKIGGLSYSDVVDDLQRSAHDYMHLAGYCFLAALGLVIVTVAELWLVYRLKQRVTLPRHEIDAG
jgi:hypothetical protein